MAHRHRWKLGEPDFDGNVEGKCWCRERRTFTPFAERPKYPTLSSPIGWVEPVGRVNTPALERKKLRRA